MIKDEKIIEDVEMDDEEIAFLPLNPVDGLSASAIPEYLLSSLEEENFLIFTGALKDVLSHYGVRLVAEAAGLSRENLYRILRGERDPSLRTVHKIVWAFKSQAITSK